MQRRYLTVDVFTDAPFGGNPLAVILDAEGLSSGQMQAIAAEFNYAETTFVLPPRDRSHTARVRIFTPRIEVPFAGHPNVGTAFVLAREIVAAGGVAPDSVVFEEDAGLVPLTILAEQGIVLGAELRAPRALVRGPTLTVADAAACLGLDPTAIEISAHPPEVLSVGLGFLVVELKSRDALRCARPDVACHEALLPPLGVDAVYAYTLDADRSDGEQTVIHARTFAPLDGVPEDPATGSASAATIALRAQLAPHRLGERRWRLHQGADMGRSSLLIGRTVLDSVELPANVYVGGRCVPMLTGTFWLTGAA